MKKAVGVLLAIIVIALAILLFDNSSSTDDSISEPISSNAESSSPRQETEDAESSTDDDSHLTRDEFDQLPQEQQDEMLEEFVLDFWEMELGLPDETTAEEESLSLKIFNRPYIQTLTEREFFELPPEDQEEAIAEVMEAGRETRSYVNAVIVEAESLMADKDYVNAEAYFAHVWEVGRELSINKDGMIIARLVGIACEKLVLNGLVKLHTLTGDSSKVQMASEQLSEIEKETEEIKRTAKEAEAKR